MRFERGIRYDTGLDIRGRHLRIKRNDYATVKVMFALYIHVAVAHADILILEFGQ